MLLTIMNFQIEVIKSKQTEDKFHIQESVPAAKGDLAAAKKTAYDFLQQEKAY